MTPQEQLEQIKKQAEQIKSQIDILASAQKSGMNITPQTSVGDAQSFLNSLSVNNKTSSSFDTFGNLSSLTGEIGKILNSGMPQTDFASNIQSLVRQLSQPSNIQQNTEAVKQQLQTSKNQAIELAKSFLETEQEKTLSALGLKTGVGSLVLESILDVQRKNALSLANLANKYDEAIANLDLQSAQNIRAEILNSLNTMVQLDNMYYQKNLQNMSLATQLSAQEITNLTNTINTLLSSEKVSSIDQLPEKTKNILNPLLTKLDRISGLPYGTTKMKFDKILSGGQPLTNIKIITTKDGGIYLFGTKGAKTIFEQLKGESPSGGISSSGFDFDLDTYLDQIFP